MISDMHSYSGHFVTCFSMTNTQSKECLPFKHRHTPRLHVSPFIWFLHLSKEKPNDEPDQYLYPGPGGPLVFQGGYHPCKKIHIIIGSFFRTKRCTRVHRLGYQKHAKLTIRVWKSYTNTCLGCVTRTCWNHMSRMFFFNDPFRTCGKISEFDKIPGYWGVRTFQAGRGYPLSDHLWHHITV